MVSRRSLAGLVGAAAALALSVTSAGAVADGAVTYTGTVGIDVSNDGKHDPVPNPVSITIQGHRITAYQFFASLRCADGSFSNVGINPAQLRPSPAPFTGRHFAVTVGNASSGIGLTARITGTVAAGRYVVGDIHVRAHADSGIVPSGPLCTAAYHWVARVQRPAAPPATPVSVELALIPVRDPLTASAYEYGIAVSSVACSGGAVAFSLTAGGHSATLTCAQTVPRPLTNAFFGLGAGSSYQVTVQPLVRAASGLVARGPAMQRQVAIPPPGSPKWRPIPGT